ncbi:MAG: hypothetical protein JXA78_18270 [Anaerolineales bacterium]|nr:hypothetical protein [Anaerolineales bacterium]
MKIRRLLSLTLFLAVVLSSCQTKEPVATEIPYPVQDMPALLYPYPAPGLMPGDIQNPGLLYPQAGDGCEVHWGMVLGMMWNGEVTKIVLTADQKVLVTLKDGRAWTSWQPEVDGVLKAIEECGDVCKDILVETE